MVSAAPAERHAEGKCIYLDATSGWLTWAAALYPSPHVQSEFVIITTLLQVLFLPNTVIITTLFPVLPNAVDCGLCLLMPDIASCHIFTLCPLIPCPTQHCCTQCIASPNILCVVGFKRCCNLLFQGYAESGNGITSHGFH